MYISLNVKYPLLLSDLMKLAFFPHILEKYSNIRVHSSVQHTHLTAQRYTTQTAYRFGHQKAVLTIVLLKMGILLLETC
jgi:hypothetical protein